jgi:protein-S-isoprenylcysteine O-methyltransferase Ste14
MNSDLVIIARRHPVYSALILFTVGASLMTTNAVLVALAIAYVARERKIGPGARHSQRTVSDTADLAFSPSQKYTLAVAEERGDLINDIFRETGQSVSIMGSRVEREEF